MCKIGLPVLLLPAGLLLHATQDVYIMYICVVHVHVVYAHTVRIVLHVCILLIEKRFTLIF